jgi:hypothetical protein
LGKNLNFLLQEWFNHSELKKAVSDLYDMMDSDFNGKIDFEEFQKQVRDLIEGRPTGPVNVVAIRLLGSERKTLTDYLTNAVPLLLLHLLLLFSKTQFMQQYIIFFVSFLLRFARNSKNKFNPLYTHSFLLSIKKLKLKFLKTFNQHYEITLNLKLQSTSFSPSLFVLTSHHVQIHFIASLCQK